MPRRRACTTWTPPTTSRATWQSSSTPGSGPTRTATRTRASWRCSAAASIPASPNIYCAYAQEHLFDSIDTIDIIDCNDGSHGKSFATNFNPEINLREVTQRGKYWKDGKWIDIDPLTISA